MAQCGDDFVRFVGVSTARVPSIVLYTDRQIRDIKSFCFNRSEGSVLGFDKTYNLSSMYVTPSVYKNVALVRRSTGVTPLFMGPVFIFTVTQTLRRTVSFFRK
jgi:hypothetical protein